MKNFKIEKRLIIDFIIVSILASISGIIGLAVTMYTDTQYSEALITNGFAQGEIGTFNTLLNKGSATVRDIIFLTDEQEIQQANQELNEITSKTDAAFTDLKKDCQTEEELKYISVLEENLPLYRQARKQTVSLGLENKNEEALAYFRSEAKPFLDQCLSAADSLAELNTTLGNQVSAQLTSQSRIASVCIGVIIVVVLIVSILLGLRIAKSIAGPIGQCSDRLDLLSEGDLHSPVPEATSKNEAGLMLTAMKEYTLSVQNIIKDIEHCLSELANGNLTIETTAEYKGDYRAIKDSITKIIASLNNTFQEINMASDQVAGGSEQVSSGAQALSQGATEQASSVEELAATINEISNKVQKTAENAQSAKDETNESGSQVELCNHQMQEMVGAMAQINDKSNEIGKIIKTIEDIAFQTNILALNAAVEAARAGAAGKGFAVVADEVRSLASKSAEASKSTSSLIEASIKAVEQGTEIANETAETLKKVVTSTQSVTVIVDDIAVAANEQATAIDQVTQGVDQISSVVQTNSATAEESAAASEELSGQAQMLKALIAQFQLKDKGETA